MDCSRLRPAICACLLLLAGCATRPPAIPGDEIVDLRPLERADPASALGPLGGMLPEAWRTPRVIEIRTAPPGAELELFYLHRNLQRRFERAEAPVHVALPPRLQTSREDALVIRAVLDGYRVDELTLEARDATTPVTIALEPLPNRLERFDHRALGGRATLVFATREALAFRLLPESRGFRVVLEATALSPAAAGMLESAANAFVERVEADPIGEDLIVRVALSDRARAAGIETRGRRWRDPSRDLRGVAIDLVPPDGSAARGARLRDALARVSAADVAGCALTWERSLRAGIGTDALARALAPGGIEDAFLHSAMRRLGEVSRGSVVLTTDGRAFRVSEEIEALAATSLASEIVGYIALLRRVVDVLEHPPDRSEALRGVVAPELSATDWRVQRGRADDAERSCIDASR